MKASKFGRNRYLRLLFRQLTFHSTRLYLREHAGEFLHIFSREPKKRKVRPSATRTYQPPQLMKLTPEQAKLKLLGSLSVGNQGAKDLLDLVFAVSAEAVPQQPASENGATSLRRTG